MDNRCAAIDIVLETRCTGCFGCANSCPVHAITMQVSEQGFYLPVVDSALCINCGICQKYCPILNQPPIVNRNQSEVRAYAAWTKDSPLRETSSSGGVFTELAKTILQKDGTVFGVGWDDDGLLNHSAVDTEEQLTCFRGSKYLQSFVGESYVKIKKMLESTDKPILFSGTPCQVAALKTFVPNHSNLVTIDLACHGVPSRAVFQKYLDYIAEDRKIVNINFRDKELGWAKFAIVVSFADGTEYRRTFREDPFLIGFLSDLYINEICHDCPFCSTPRQGDITLADYWGVPNEFKDKRGVSLILSNNEKGDWLLAESLKAQTIEIHSTPFETAIPGNPRLVDGHLVKPLERGSVYSNLSAKEFDEIIPIIEQVNRFKR